MSILNKKAYYYYTLLLLETYLSIEQFTSDDRAVPFVEKMLLALTNIVKSTNGLCFGNPSELDEPLLGYNDIGVTARYLFVVSKYSQLFEINSLYEEAFHKGVEFILNNIFDFKYSTKNFVTHGWEAVLELISILDDSSKKKLFKTISNKTMAENSELSLFVSSISERDFQGKKPVDLQSTLLQFLSKELSISTTTNKFKNGLIFDTLCNYQFIQEQLNMNFTRDSFIVFLNKYGIPYRDDSNMEELIDTALFHFQFQKLV